MASTPEGGTRKLAAIMFTDVRDFSKKMSENEIAAMELLKVHDTMVRDTVVKYGGIVIKSLGDSFMVDFSSAVNAVRCAIEAQEQFWHYNQGKSEFDKIQIRVGIHLGDVITVGNDIYGDGVNIAARIEAITEPTRICVSADIYNQVKNKMPIRAYSIGSIDLKNIAEPVEVLELLIDSIPEFSVPSESAKQVPTRRKAELLSSQEEEEANRVEAAKRKVDEEQQREDAEKQERANGHFLKAEEYVRAGDSTRPRKRSKKFTRSCRSTTKHRCWFCGSRSNAPGTRKINVVSVSKRKNAGRKRNASSGFRNISTTCWCTSNSISTPKPSMRSRKSIRSIQTMSRQSNSKNRSALPRRSALS